MEADEGQSCGGGTTGREHRGRPNGARLQGDQRPVLERILEPSSPGQFAVEVLRKVVIGDEDVGFAAQAPPQRGPLPVAGTGQ